MENEINLSKFLSRYANLKGKNLTKLKHDDVKELFPYLKRASFEMIEKNKQLLYQGKILLVTDGIRTIPYYAPSVSNEEIEENEVYLDSKGKKNNKSKKYDYASMNEHELRLLLRKKFNSYKDKKNAFNELKNRGIVLRKKYDRNKEKEILKGEMKND